MTLAAFDLAGELPRQRTLIEASAGTGKTYTIAALIVRYLAGETGADGHGGEPVTVDQLLVVTFTRAAASELRDRVRAKLRAALAHLDDPGAVGRPPATDPWMTTLDAGSPLDRQRRAGRLRDALARFDEATITTIHGFCQQALAQAGLRSNVDQGLELVPSTAELLAEVVRDRLITDLTDDPYALSSDASDRPPARVDGEHDLTDPGRRPEPPSIVERRVIQTIAAVLTNAGATCLPAAGIGGTAGRWTEVVAAALDQVEERQRTRRQISYDRLVSDLARLLDTDGSGALAAQLADRYRLVLVDEFQDTDPLQWKIFDSAFGARRLITVGDPKQAIYRFRGADVHAYLAAVERASPVALGTNHRSDRRLLDALAVLFDGATLGHPHITFARVTAAPGAPLNALTEGRSRGAAVHIRVVPDDPEIPRTTTTRTMESGAVQRIVLTDVASRIRALLDVGSIDQADGERRPVRPADIAVLVPSQRRAADTAAVLRDWGIPSVRSRTGSVLESPAATQWRLLLAGIARPTYARAARAAGLSWFFDLEPSALIDRPTGDTGETGDSALAALQRELAVLGHRLRSDGLGAFSTRLREESRLLDVVLSRPNGDRNLTDLDHVADLLVAEMRGRSTEPFEVREALDQLVASSNVMADEAMRRIETDDQAVTITTIHAAKGLEYPIVLLPFAYVERGFASRPYVYHDMVDGRPARVVDVASWTQWGDGVEEGSKPGSVAMDARKGRATAEVDGDGLRLAYVAMTRAKHRLELWWAPTRRAATSAFGRLLLDRDGAGPVNNTPPALDRKEAPPDYFEQRATEAAAQIDTLVEASRGALARFDVPLSQPVRRPLGLGGPDRQALAVADGSTRVPLDDGSWRNWSFTTISSRMAAADPATGPGAVPVDGFAGGTDEPVDRIDSQVPAGAVPLGEPMRRSNASMAPAVPLANVVGGTTFGTMVHGVLEAVLFDSPSVEADIAAAVADGVRRAGLVGSLDADAVTAGLTAALATPLGPLFDQRPLRSISPRDRLAELSFDLRLGDGRAAVEAIPAHRVGDALLATLPPGDPLRPYAVELSAALEPIALDGWLTGSIDAVFRVGSTGAERYVVVDYKSNRLHPAGTTDPDAVLAAYHPARLVDAMTHSHYPLQAVLYAVALHRYLTWRLGAAYDPERHLGGIAYLFVRGMVGPATPSSGADRFGVFSWRPPVATVVALDAVLRGVVP